MTAITEYRSTLINGWRVTLAARGYYFADGKTSGSALFVEVREPGKKRGVRFDCKSPEIAESFYLLALQRVRLHVA